MLVQAKISKLGTLDPAMDHRQLYAAGLAHVQNLAHQLWTDYNTHDPGVTILEMLCYALTDLSYRASAPVADLLASSRAISDDQAEHGPLFPAQDILPNRPLTLHDYRKLLIDIEGVKNAWIMPAALSYFADKGKGLMLFPALLFTGEIIDLASLAAKLKSLTDPLARYLHERFSLTTQQMVTGFDGSEDSADWLRAALTRELNGVIEGPSIYDTARFQGVNLSKEANALIAPGASAAVQRLNRLLLEDAYPVEIAKHVHLRALTGSPMLEAVPVVGLYNVLIEYMENVTSEERRREILAAARRQLQANRNLCEDFVNISDVTTEEFRLCCESELDAKADVEQVAAEILFRVQGYLAPPVASYELSEMLTRKNPDGTFYTLEQIFAGPLLKNGFIDDADLARAELRREIRLSDVIREIMHIDGVRAVRDIVINPKDANTPLENKWLVAVAPGKQARLDGAASRLVFYKRGMPVVPDAARVSENLSRRIADAARKIESWQAAAVALPSGQKRDLESYYSFQNHFPAIYGISEVGLPLGADEQRRALAYQLKGYLLFFDQLMANYLAQLSHVKELFSTDPTISHTYFDQVVATFTDHEKIYRSQFISDDFTHLAGLVAKFNARRDPIAEFLWQKFSPETRALLEAFTGAEVEVKPLKQALADGFTTIIRQPNIYDPVRFKGIPLSPATEALLASKPKLGDWVLLNRHLLEDAFANEIVHYHVEDREQFAARRNRFLDHLIARFGESFAEYAHVMYAAFGAKPAQLIASKCDFLRQYPRTSGERGLAYDFTLREDQDLWNSQNVSGLERRLAGLLGLSNFTRRNLGDMVYDIFTEVDATPGNEFRFRVRDRVTRAILLSSSTHYTTAALAHQEMQQALHFAARMAGYERKRTSGGKHYFNIVDDTGAVLARRIEYFDSVEEMNQAIDELVAYVGTHYSEEGMYVIENILLRPENSSDPLLPVCADPNCTDCANLDPYSYRIHVMLPAEGGRFRDPEFRRFAESVIREETPAHILAKICWIGKDDLAVFEKLYRDWIYLKAGRESAARKEKLVAFIDGLFSVKNIYEQAQLVDCDSDPAKTKVILGQARLGSLPPAGTSGPNS